MTSQAIMSISAAVVALVSLLKWAGVRDNYGPIAVLSISFMGVIFWGWSTASLTRASAFDYFSGWVVVSTSAAGVYGFSRASGTALTKLTAPPSTGAGSEPTIKG